jgi:LacI family transcriptional regulator
MTKSRSQPTLADVARTADVGVATVSRVVNGGTNVSPKTLKKVQAAIRQLGYLPNHAARILKGGRTKIVGLLVPSIADYFFASCAEAAGEIASLHDSLLIVAVNNNDCDTELENLAALMRHRPDGLLIVPADTGSKRLVSFVRSSTVPIVTFDRPIPGGGCASVLTDNFEAARTATDHLIEHGYRRILCFGGEPDLYTIRERLRGYSQAIEEAGLPLLVDTTLSGDANSAACRLSKHLASPHPPDAIFTLKNSATTATIQSLQRLKVSIPSDIALLGFDDFELASTLRPPVSVVQQPNENLGRKAAELLFAQLERGLGSDRPSRFSCEPLVLPNRLVIRSSCGCKMRASRSS